MHPFGVCLNTADFGRNIVERDSIDCGDNLNHNKNIFLIRIETKVNIPLAVTYSVETNDKVIRI